MDCRSFQDQLRAYLSGTLLAEAFAEMVTHEAACPACHERACAEMPGAHGPLSDETRSPAESQDLPAADTPALLAGSAADAWLDGVLRRTLGTDCSQIAHLVAQEVDGPQEERWRGLIETHLAECAHCRELARVLRNLPAAYARMPRLRAGERFTRAVLARTTRPSPGFLETLAAMWRKPALLWEGALVCALLTAPVLGGPIRQVTAALVERVQQGDLPTVEAPVAWESLGEGVSLTRTSFADLTDAGTLLRGPFRAVRGWGEKACDRLLAPGAPAGTGVTMVRVWIQMLFNPSGAGRSDQQREPAATRPSPGSADSTAGRGELDRDDDGSAGHPEPAEGTGDDGSLENEIQP